MMYRWILPSNETLNRSDSMYRMYRLRHLVYAGGFANKDVLLNLLSDVADYLKREQSVQKLKGRRMHPNTRLLFMR